MLDTFLNILGVIGIIVVAAFIIVFLSDLFISIVDGTNGIFFKRHKKDEDKPVTRPKLLNAPDEEQERPVLKQAEEETPAAPAPKTEESEEMAPEQGMEETEVDLDKAAKEEAALKASNLQPQQEAVVVPAQKEADPDEVIAEITEETRKEVARLDEEKKAQAELDEAQKQAEEAMSQAEAAQKQAEDAETRQKELEEKIAELERQLEENQKTIKDLEDKSAEENVTVVSGSREELEQRLDVLKQRLKENEKELSANKKEFLPLRRVNMTLDNDKRKLRRKEAIVAKQKVVLYGVNNYVDIDEEKANKLTQELDLLEGLRLSVQHCEEVMQKNKDRYPILERANAFLNKNHDELKMDIADLEEKIRILDEQAAKEAEENVNVVPQDDNTSDDNSSNN